MANAATFGTMVESQIRINDVMRPAWLTEPIAWSRSVWTKAGEGVVHLGWEWWKNKPDDIKQARLDLVDILHYSISHELMFKGQGELAEDIAAGFMSAQDDGTDTLNLVELFERLAFMALQSRYGHDELRERVFGPPFFAVLFRAMRISGMELEDIATKYTGKNTLNLFRQMNGDRELNYPRLWNGVEDNVHLTEITEVMISQGVEISLNGIYERLGERFSLVHERDYVNQHGWFSKEDPAF